MDKTPCFLIFWKRLFLIGFALNSFTQIQAQTLYWDPIGSSPYNWSDPNNWSTSSSSHITTGYIPGINDDVIVPTGKNLCTIPDAAVTPIGVIPTGFLTSVNLVSPGSGYSSAPTVTISGGGGTGATATATVSGGLITGFTLTAIGSGYTTAPTVSISGGGGSNGSATATVYLSSGNPYYRCKSLTIQSNAAVYNQATASGGGILELNISNDLIINDNGYYFSGAQSLTIGRDLWIQGGSDTNASPGGSFVLVYVGSNKINIGRNCINEGTLGRKQISSINLTASFNTNQNAFIYNKLGKSRDRNIYVQEDLNARTNFSFSTRFGSILGGSTMVLKCGAFDNMEVTKNKSTLENSGAPTGSFPNLVSNRTTVNTAILVGIVGDGVNDFDGNSSTDPVNTLFLSGSGKLSVFQGCVYVNNVEVATANAYNTETLHSLASNRVWDGSTTHPQGGTYLPLGGIWAVPNADISVRGDLVISDALYGTSSYNGASLDLYGYTTRKDSICMHLGGNLQDLNTSEPAREAITTTTSTTRRGLYVNLSDQIYDSFNYQLVPILVFNGTNDQSIEGQVPNIRDFNNLANQGQGMVLPNVILRKPNNNSTKVIISGNNGMSALRIFGQLTIFNGEFNTNSKLLIFGDNYNDEINVHGIGDPSLTDPSTSDAMTFTNFSSLKGKGVFKLSPGSVIKMSSDNSTNNGDFLSIGTIMRGRRGGEIILEGDNAGNLSKVDRDSRVGGRLRIALYSGARLRARYASFTAPGNTTTGYAIAGTVSASDNATGGTFSRGGLKVYVGAVMYDYNASKYVGNPSTTTQTAAINSLSDCLLQGANNNTLLTFDPKGYFRTENTTFSDNDNNNNSCISSKTEGEIRFYQSNGSAGGVLGEMKDGGSADSSPDRIIWDNATVALWYGVTSTSWNTASNWIIADQPGGSNAGPAWNPDNLIPGRSSFYDVSVIIPRKSLKDCIADVAFLINGTLVMEGSGNIYKSTAGVSYSLETSFLNTAFGYVTYLTGNTPRDISFTLNSSLTAEVQSDILLYWQTTMNLNSNSTLNLGGALMALFCRTANLVSASNNATINAASGSKLNVNGSKDQQISPRANKLYNFTVVKGGGLANAQGISYQTNADGSTGGSNQYTLRIDGEVNVSAGKFQMASDTRLDIKGNFLMSGTGVFAPLNSIVILRGNFIGTGASSSVAGSQTFAFHPYPGNIISRNITVTSKHKFNNVELNDSNAIPIGNGTNETIASNTKSVTYNLASDFDVIGALNIFINRILTNQTYTLSVGYLNVNSGGRLNVYSTSLTSGVLQMYTSAVSGVNTININSGGRIDMLGTESNYVKFTRADNLSTYAFNIKGQFSTRYYISEYTNANGIYIQKTASSISPGVITLDGGGKNYVNGSTSVSLTPVYEGSGATATATVVGSGVKSVNVDNGGSGYTSAPNVVFATTYGSGAVATANMLGSPINTVSITTGGTGYNNASTVTGLIAASVTFSAPTGIGSPTATAIGQAVVDNQVTSYMITSNGGNTYTQSPSISFDIPYTGASNNAIATGLGILTASNIATVSITSGGTGYSVGDVINFISADGATGPYVTVATVDASGAILTVSAIISNAALKQPISVGETSIGDGAVWDVTVVATTLASIQITNGGYGYSISLPPAITISGAANANAIVSNLSGTIRDIYITNYGDGYLSSPTIAISGGGGSGASATATTDGGSVQSITITTAGSYYQAPIVSFTGGGGGSGASATSDSDGGTVSSLTLVTAGLAYRTAPIVAVSSTGGGIGSGASAYATISASPVTQINILNGGSGYSSSVKPTLILRAANPDVSPQTIADYTIPPANIIVSDGVATRVQVIVKGSGYVTGDILKDANGGLYVISADSSGSIKTGSNPGYPVGLSISKGGSSQTLNSTITLSCSTCAGTPTVAAQVKIIAIANGVITSISTGGVTALNTVTGLTRPSYGTANTYNTAPILIVTQPVANPNGGFSGKPILDAGKVTSVVIKIKRRYPVASMSNGIFTNSAYAGSAISIDADFTFYRSTGNPSVTNPPLNLIPTWKTTAPANSGYSLDWDYGAAISNSAGPRIDTIYNVIFAKNPAVDQSGGSYSASFNVTRIGTTTTAANIARNRIIFKDAIGTFSGEGYDQESTETVVANTPNAQLNPYGIVADSMIIWREPNVKRWDGGPDNLGTSWSDPQNWRPDGVPQDYNDVILDYSLLNVDYSGTAATSAGYPIPQVPSTLFVDMNYDFTGISSATCKSLSFVPIIQPQKAGQKQNIITTVKMDVNNKLRVAGTISIPSNATLNVNQANNIIEVGETWTNNGVFNNGNGIVNFYKNSSRAIINKLNPTSPGSVDTDITDNSNGFYKLIFSDGVSDMSSNMLVLSNLSIRDGATLNSNNNIIYLNGNWDNAGDFDESQGAIFFRGSTLQTVSKTPSIISLDAKKQNFYNVVMGKGSGSSLSGAQGHVKLLNRVEISGNLYLNSGRILTSNSTNATSAYSGSAYMDNGAELILSQSASIQGTPSASSFVQGPLGRLTNSTVATDLNYPVGSEKQGKNFNASITAISGSVTAITPVVAGTGYEVSNRFTIPGGNGDATVIVTAVNASGGITSLNIVNVGSGYTTGTITPTWLSGAGKGIYVGPSGGSSVILKQLSVNSNKPTLFMVEQVEDKYPTNPTTRSLPTGTPNLNYIFEDRYWNVKNIPYLYTSNALGSNSYLNSSQITLYLSPNSQLTSINGNALTSSQISSNYLKDARVVKDSDNTYNGTGTPANDPTYISATPSGFAYSGAANATQKLIDGLAVMSTQWVNAGSTAVDATTNVTDLTNSTPITSTAFSSLGNGNFAIALNYTALPIDGLTLEAKLVNAQVQIKWTVVGEQAINKYLVERSRDGITFESLGEQTAKNIPSVVYAYLDKKPLSGTSYYRVTQIKKDGKSNTSNLVSIVFDNTLNYEKAFIVYPNPLSSGADLSIQLPLVASGEQILVSLMDINGRIVFTQSYISDGNILIINFARDLPEGLYIMNVKSPNDEYKTKIVINR